MVLSDFAKGEALKIERRVFVGKIFGVLMGYVGITFWLNAIRASASLWFVWVLIIIQFLLYFSIFSISWSRSKECGLNPSLGFIIFVILAVLGRIENWELFIIPSVVIIMLVISAINKNQQLVKE